MTARKKTLPLKWIQVYPNYIKAETNLAHVVIYVQEYDGIKQFNSTFTTYEVDWDGNIKPSTLSTSHPSLKIAKAACQDMFDDHFQKVFQRVTNKVKRTYKPFKQGRLCY